MRKYRRWAASWQLAAVAARGACRSHGEKRPGVHVWYGLDIWEKFLEVLIAVLFRILAPERLERMRGRPSSSLPPLPLFIWSCWTISPIWTCLQLKTTATHVSRLHTWTVRVAEQRV